MKIIGKTANGYILDADGNEVANLLGFYSKYNMDDALRIGDRINVHSMYESLTAIASKEKEMAEARKILRTVADALQLVDPVIREVSAAASGKAVAE